MPAALPPRGSVVVCVLAAGDDVDAAVDAAAPADVALVEPGVWLPPDWLERLSALRGDDGTVATVSAVAVGGAAVSDPDRAAAAAAVAVRSAGVRLVARTAAPDPACHVVTRAALELCGPLDAGFPARCTASGFVHVLAGDVLVLPPARGDGQERDAGDAGCEGHATAADERPDPEARLRRRARHRVSGLAVTIDARILGAALTGTQVHTLELIAALARTRALRLRVLLPPAPSPTALALLDTLDGIERLSSDDVTTRTAATALVHRPYQVTSHTDVPTLRQVGERLVVTHQDLIGYHNASYHADATGFDEFRLLTRSALAAADAVVAFSRHVADDLLAEDLVTPERVTVVPIGVDHALAALAHEPRAPAAAGRLLELPYLLCLGADLRHKNRTFAIDLLAALHERGWRGRLVLAGPHAARGGSAALEAERLAAHPATAASVLDLDVPDEAEKAWLYAHAAAVVYPTVNEGFGLIPFEAAAHGTPCLFAAQGALSELLRPHARLVPWDAGASADRTLELMSGAGEAEALTAAIAQVGQRLSWDDTAAALLDVYDRALVARASSEVAANRIAADAVSHTLRIREEIGPTGLSLVGRDGLLTEPAQRTLAGLGRRPATRRALLATLELLHRLVVRGDR